MEITNGRVVEPTNHLEQACISPGGTTFVFGVKV